MRSLFASTKMNIRPPADSLTFEPTRALLNPKFETYQLQVPTNSSTLHALPNSGIKLRTLPDHARLSFAEVQARVRHNHLSAGFGGECVYIDGELRVVAVTLNQVCRSSPRRYELLLIIMNHSIRMEHRNSVPS